MKARICPLIVAALIKRKFALPDISNYEGDGLSSTAGATAVPAAGSTAGVALDSVGAAGAVSIADAGSIAGTGASAGGETSDAGSTGRLRLGGRNFRLGQNRDFTCRFNCSRSRFAFCGGFSPNGFLFRLWRPGHGFFGRVHPAVGKFNHVALMHEPVQIGDDGGLFRRRLGCGSAGFAGAASALEFRLQAVLRHQPPAGGTPNPAAFRV